MMKKKMFLKILAFICLIFVFVFSVCVCAQTSIVIDGMTVFDNLILLLFGWLSLKKTENSESRKDIDLWLLLLLLLSIHVFFSRWWQMTTTTNKQTNKSLIQFFIFAYPISSSKYKSMFSLVWFGWLVDNNDKQPRRKKICYLFFCVGISLIHSLVVVQ